MDFMSQRTATSLLSDVIVKTGVSLFNTLKYVYSIAEDDFYNCSIKDVLKIVLNNITDTSCLADLVLRADKEKSSEMDCDEYRNVLSLIIYSFAVRIPILKKTECNGQHLSDAQLLEIYNAVISKGACNYKNSVDESFDGIKKLIKQKKNIPAYNGEWYKTFIYTNVPSLSEIKNKNIFLLGAADILFTMFYACLQDELESTIKGMDKL